jgi:hypothetical protein
MGSCGTLLRLFPCLKELLMTHKTSSEPPSLVLSPWWHVARWLDRAFQVSGESFVLARSIEPKRIYQRTFELLWNAAILLLADRMPWRATSKNTAHPIYCTLNNVVSMKQLVTDERGFSRHQRAPLDPFGVTPIGASEILHSECRLW